MLVQIQVRFTNESSIDASAFVVVCGVAVVGWPITCGVSGAICNNTFANNTVANDTVRGLKYQHKPLLSIC